MCQLDRLKRLKAKIYRIAQKYKVEKLYVFGSCARKEETPESDIDFLVEFIPHASLFDQCGLKVDLEDLLQCNVDVISSGALRNDKFASNVQRDKVLIC